MQQQCGPTGIAFQDGVVQANGKEYILTTLDLLVEGSINFSLNPVAVDGMFGSDSIYISAFT